MKAVQAKHVSEAVVLAAIAHARYPNYASRDEVERAFPGVPPKVVLAKLRAMIKRKIIDGCACGCRGDFMLYVPPLGGEP